MINDFDINVQLDDELIPVQVEIENSELVVNASQTNNVIDINVDIANNNFLAAPATEPSDQVLPANLSSIYRGPTGAAIVSTELVGQDQQGGNIYKQTFDNGFVAYFTAPRGPAGGGPGGSTEWIDVLNKPFNTLDSTTLKVTNGQLAVNTTNIAQQDNTQPITSSGVNTIVGNINALLELI